MPDLLLELFSEEIPARMQARAAAELERKVNGALLEAGFMPEGVKAFATPRRLAFVASGLPARQPDRREEKKGPRIGAPEKAIAGFLKSAGLSSLDQCERREDKKGAYYVAVVDKQGRDTSDIIAEAIPEILRGFSWPKSMRWGEKDLRWVRPLHSVLCAFNGEVVSFDIDGVSSGDKTRGHRFMAPGEVQTRNFDDYVMRLRAAKVILDGEERKEIIAGDAATLCQAQGLELVEDDALLSEVAGLAEWPVAMIGSFDQKFLALPDEVLTAVMRGHQKYFSVRDPKTGRLANKFIFAANLEAPDGGAAMRAGYERVLAARLSDAWFLYQQDLKRPLEDRVKDLDKVTFFEGLGSVGDKARRVAALAKEIAPAVGAAPETAERAGLLAKADLVSAMVYEFPELQGVMGRYYYLAQSGVSSSPVHGGGVAEGDGGGRGAPPSFEARPVGLAPQDEDGAVGGAGKKNRPHPEAPAKRASKDGQNAQTVQQIADAIRDHYKPAGQDDAVPTAPVSVAVALADKIDTLTAFWAIDKKPTGSSDPFALRRAALGVIQLILSSGTRFPIRDFMLEQSLWVRDTNGMPRPDYDSTEKSASIGTIHICNIDHVNSFFHDRLKVYLRDKGHRYDAIDAVLTDADGNLQDDLVLIVRKLEALEAFLKTDDGENLAILYKRAANILKAEEKKEDVEDVGRVERSDTRQSAPHGGYRPSASTRPTVEAKLFRQAEEKALFAALKEAETKADKAVKAEDFEAAMGALSRLRAPLDAFFDHVTVNAEEPDLRANRLALLARLRSATATVADFSKLEG
jgi:glycyl-tRNA synthetase beta chain